MATKIQSIEVTQQRKVFVKSEQALKEMQSNGQLEPNTDYYTPEEGQPIQLFRNYPVGSIYISTYSTDPALPVEQGGLGGGSWEQLEDRFLLGAGNTYSNGDTGGNLTHTHGLSTATAQIAQTSGSIYSNRKTSTNKLTANAGSTITVVSSTWDVGKVGTALEGDTDASNNLPPYLVVYMWKRIG